MTELVGSSFSSPAVAPPDGWPASRPLTFATVMDAVGWTPLVRVRPSGPDESPLWAKLEFLNPSGSVKDRPAVAMIDAAEASGALLPGGTIVEATSGNTGIGLAAVAAARGYRCICTVPDKTSAEKIGLLRAYGVEVVICPGGVPTHDPRHVRNVAQRLAEERPGGWLASQYSNQANAEAHYRTTGPELWAQTEGRLTHLVAGIGTGGTISGTARYLKEVSDGRVTVVGADPTASVYSGGDGRPYFVESIGHFLHPRTVEDEWPTTYDRTLVDRFERVDDRASLHAARALARTDGILVGGSAGTALVAARRVAATAGPDALVAVILPDSGRSYLSKIFDDDWMVTSGFLDRPGAAATVAGALGHQLPSPEELAVVEAETTVGEAAAGWASTFPVDPPDLVIVAAQGAPIVRAHVVGVVRPVALQRQLAAGTLAPDQTLGDAVAAGPAPRFAGSGEDAAALAGDTPVVVVHDGYVVAVVPGGPTA